ncbi:hypothetical protein PRN20_02630 [Devosia sp. ZB163]|uniref:hypothetical protein n=1 Tax=Devosia sp. ZB163 TaxID=3025938 RepID=UPI00236049EC|nr:hypothetical protein [Devosia sp. ZB163]MDC9822618.1 hypothetical protein [Devosia sp. ZB163]
MRTQTLAAALACLTALSAPAQALDLGLGASIGVGASTSAEGSGLSLGVGADLSAGASMGAASPSDTVSTSASLTANASADASLTADDELGQIIALIDASVWTTKSLSGVTATDATAYDVAAWIDSGNQAAFDLALSANADEIEDLQAAVAANQSLESWLEANNATAEDVIAIGVTADGSLAVFTN